jgi:hypothetical protein
MVKLATESGWIMIEQKVEPDPLEIIASKLTDDECEVPLSFQKSYSNNTQESNDRNAVSPSAIGNVIQGIHSSSGGKDLGSDGGGRVVKF